MTSRLLTPRAAACLVAVVLAAVLGALAVAGTAAAQAPKGDARAFNGVGIWIWQVPQSSGGDPARIAAVARARGVSTVFVKAAHGASYWGQFSPAFVSALKARGLKVCAYQRMLGARPAAEAEQAARAVRSGADCFVIDAESEYNNKASQARTYMRTLRAKIGAAYPVGFTSFPYVSLHRAVPYSVFLGAGGAQYNLPQVYWKAIGNSPDQAMARTYRENRPYGKPIRPIGQAYDRPPVSQIRRFKLLARRYHSAGYSWWSWQSAAPAQFQALGTR
jgi:hypothetical protein